MLPYSACIVKHFLPSRLYIFAQTLPFPRVLPYNRHMEFKYFKNMLVVSGVKPFDLEKCCTCGQAFRWVKNPVHMQAGLFDECGLPDAEASLAFTGVIRGRAVLVMQSDDSLIVTPCAKGEAQLFIDYFDLKRDYSAVEAALAADERLRVCLPGSSGIRVFNQEPFEALISFIISANNNIKRISGIIDRLCSLAGEKLPVRYFSDCAAADCDFGKNSEVFAFPTPERIAALSEDELKQIGAGYRAPYIIKSAKRIADGYDLEKLRSLPTAEARKELLTFPGVGPKVADCILLFSLGHSDAFPVDVWIERAMTELYFSDSSTADVSAPALRLQNQKFRPPHAASASFPESFSNTSFSMHEIKNSAHKASRPKCPNAELNIVLKNDNTERLLLSSARRRKNICIMFNIGQAAHMGQTAFKEQADMPFYAVIRHGIAAVRIALN